VVSLAGCTAPTAPESPTASVAETEAPPSDDVPELIWSDEFEGPAGALPNPSTWNFEVGGAGWGNNELECYTQVPGNVSTDGNGSLVITALYQPGHGCVDGSINDFTSARITTQNKYTTQYGRLEVRAKLPYGAGTWPAFWALGEPITEVGWPAAGEIDVMEVVGSQPTTVHGSLHGPTADGSPFFITRALETGIDFSADFHTFAAEWTPDAVTYFLDDEEYGSITRADIEQKGEWVFDHPFYLLLNLAVGGNFPGPPDSSTVWPQSYTIDYVRVFG
jgi:beta-glucanase (GH16 family)